MCRWSSYRANALGVDCDVTSKSEMYVALGKDRETRMVLYRGLFEEERDKSLITELRKFTQKGLGFGRIKFKEKIEQWYERRVRSERPGAKPDTGK